MLCAGAAAQGRTRGLNFFVWNFAWDRLASRLYAATATTFLMKMHFCSKFGNCNLNCWWVMAWTSSKWGKFWLWSSIWPWRSDQSSHKTIGILTKVFYISGPKLVILAWTSDELLCGQARDYRTHGQTDGHTDRRRQRQYLKAKTGLG